ncbi:MAG: hypothetical protein H6732_12545 [Alphaproteobacteria bacterium]|nr:hypothetical protein [Alphaproteobacteria bacterium]
MIQLDTPIDRPQTRSTNRPESPFVHVVGESAVHLAAAGLTPVRLEGLPPIHDLDGGRLVRARRDRVGRVGEFRAFVAEQDVLSVMSLAFVPRPSLDMGVYGAEIALSPSTAVACFGIYAGYGTWFAGEHAHHAWQVVRRVAPDLVPDEGQRSARARQRGFTLELEVPRDELHRLEDLHRQMWAVYLRSMHDALELDADGAEKNARSVEAWKAHRRTVALASRVLTDAGAHDAAQVHADVISA